MKFFTPLLCVFLHTSSLFGQVDTVPPVLQSHNLTLFHSSECERILYVIDFIDTVYDDQTDPHLIELGMRKVCTGEGFPVEQEIYIGVYEFAQVEIWARDLAGNTTVQTVQAYMVLTGIACDPSYFFNAKTPTMTGSILEGIHHVDFHVEAYHCLNDSLNLHFNSLHYGHASNMGHAYPVSHGGRATASKDDDPLNGVTTNDLVLISRHILGLQPFDSPYKIIAADANQDGKVTAFDIVILRKLILGITDELPNGKSWRFIPKSYIFPNPADPFFPAFPSEISWPIEHYTNLFEFIGVKIGDVNFSADPSQ